MGFSRAAETNVRARRRSVAGRAQPADGWTAARRTDIAGGLKTVQLLFRTSVAFAFVAWAVVATLYIWPQLSTQSRIDALRPLLVLHAFRFIGLAFLVPGVVSPDLPLAFARDAAYGGIVAAIRSFRTATVRS